MKLCPICQKELILHNTTQVNEVLKKTYSCVADKILVSETGEILLTDFDATPNLDAIKSRLNVGFDLSFPEQVDEMTTLIISLLKYAESLEKQLKEKSTLLDLLRNAQLTIKRAAEVLEVTDE